MRELHLHLDGSLRPETVEDLAREKGLRLGDIKQIRKRLIAPKECRSLNEYLERFGLPFEFLQRGDWLERISFELVEDLAKFGLEYGELRFAPQYFTKDGLSQANVVDFIKAGVKRGMKAYPNIKIGLILCAMRGKGNEKENLETLSLVEEKIGEVVCGLDLAGAEALFPTKDFEYIFSRARDKNLPFTIHAGEAQGPDSIWQALEFGAKRIGHGVRAIEDERLVKYLVENKITLEVCITSNLQTKLVEKISDHPIKRLFDKGVRVTLNSDNMTVSDTNLLKERRLAVEKLGFSEADLEKMDSYAKEASFLKENSL